MDLIALIVMGSLVITGLVSPPEAVAGFSNAAVIAIWAMFVISDGLTRTGIANLIGNSILKIAGAKDINMIVIVMLIASFFSAFMNNIGVAALMLPVVIDIARRTRVPVSKLLMPLAYGCLLGGLTTLIGNTPNLLISNSLTESGFEAFKLFDFAPIGIVCVFSGILFMVIFGRHFLPKKALEEDIQKRSQRNLRTQYGLQSHTFEIKVPKNSILEGKTRTESKIGIATGLIVLAIKRGINTEFMPPRNKKLKANDRLIIQGTLDRFQEFLRWSELVIEREAPVLQGLMSTKMKIVEVSLEDNSTLVGNLIQHPEFRKQYGSNILAIKRGELIRRNNLSSVPLKKGDHLLLQTLPENYEELNRSLEFSSIREIEEKELIEIYSLEDSLFVVSVPKESTLAGQNFSKNRFGDAFDFRLLAIFREGELIIMPPSDQNLKGGDILLIEGQEEDLNALRGLQEFELQESSKLPLNTLESDRLNIIEIILDPRSSLIGQLLSELNFRDKYGLEPIAIWREGKAIRSNLNHEKLKLGDALLTIGPREQINIFQKDNNFIVLTPDSQKLTKTEKAPIAISIMVVVLFSVLAGWFPIYISAIIGATLMILFKCISMEEAYLAINWRVIFLIAGMLPLGTAMENSGAAALIANQVMNVLSPLGPWWVIAGLYVITAIATMAIPTAALVVLMAPIVLSASINLGIHPQTAMMAVAIAASASFASPVSHPANILVMGPGGYRFSDYLKLGLPLSVIIFIITMYILPIIWPIEII